MTASIGRFGLDGQGVRIADGPFAGFEGEIAAMNIKEETVVIQVSFFSRKTAITLGLK